MAVQFTTDKTQPNNAFKSRVSTAIKTINCVRILNFIISIKGNVSVIIVMLLHQGTTMPKQFQETCLFLQQFDIDRMWIFVLFYLHFNA